MEKEEGKKMKTNEDEIAVKEFCKIKNGLAVVVEISDLEKLGKQDSPLDMFESIKELLEKYGIKKKV